MKVSYVTDASRDACLENMMAKTGVKTKQAMIDNAVVAFEWLVEQKEKGRAIVSVDRREYVEKELVMPVLSGVKREGQDEEVLG